MYNKENLTKLKVMDNLAPEMMKAFRAFDKATGEVLAEIALPAGTTGAPMTYLHRGKQYIVVPVGGRDVPPEWVALSLP